MNTVVLAESATLDEGLLSAIRLVRAAGAMAFEITLVNLTDADVTGELRPLSAAPFAMPAALPFACASGAAATVVCPVEVTGSFWETARVAFDLRVADRSPRRLEFSAWPLMRDASFELCGNDTAEKSDGQKSLRLDPAMDGYNARHFPMALTPNHRYRVSIAYKRTPGKSDMSFALIWQRLDESSNVRKGQLPFDKDGDWDRTEIVFDAADSFVSTDLYVYNVRSERTLWVDDVRVEDLGPVDATAGLAPTK
jgi:hypothetical protein